MAEEKTKAPDYEQMTHEDLTAIARERGVENIEAHRKADFRKLLKAQDEGDRRGVEEVRKTVAERMARTEAANAPANRIMEKAKANAGIPMAAMPKTDSAKVKVGAAVEAAKHVSELKKEAEAPALPAINPNASGAEIVQQIQARAEALRNGATAKAAPTRSLAMAALAASRAAAGGAEPELPKAGVYEVLEATSYFSRHGVYKLAKGSLVTTNTHDVESLIANGAKLQEIDPERTRIVYSELGHPLRLETTPVQRQEG
jgi:hypothetical protein